MNTALPAMLTHPFLQHAFLAGTAVALAAGVVGCFLVLRAQVFTADALSHVAFTGPWPPWPPGWMPASACSPSPSRSLSAWGVLSPRAQP
jgi:zinc/manganese transport system permease protein